ncbi:polyphosphate kinase 2 family protein [Alterisphingorhabdus coralli]|uniref:Polyphosphate kinase n=1 Tax=Alterisphingorhabdus coralli TaxID=3071408 RepID=A0AA97FBK9_9SPHN|nr:polyphosphate kinase [Parasphingorhabdus sp. SCSIO 66989]WOE76647.1 polyphosphate kinase [Parasphingorhabdus sp. SCSIO 66989]
MTINLSDYEKGASFDGDYGDALKAVQRRLARVHFAHIVHQKRAMIVFEGWDAAGKGGIIRRMSAEWDPRYFEVYPIGAPSKAEKERHFLWRFWRNLPGTRNISVFDRSWYGRVLVERVEGFCTEEQWRRAYDEINEFEAQQVDDGTTLIKIFLHTTQKTQDKRFADRLNTPRKRWKMTADDFRNRARREEYLTAYADMFAHTDTRWAPWAVFDSNNKKAARIAVMNHIADRLEEAVPVEFPEIDAELVKLAKKAFGYKPEKE